MSAERLQEAMYRNDRCAGCRTSIDLDWDADVCPCGSVATCRGCDPVDHCEDCRIKRDSPFLGALPAAIEQAKAVQPWPKPPGPRRVIDHGAPDLTTGDLALGPLAIGPRFCARCDRGIAVGEQCATHWPTKGSTVAYHYHPTCVELGETA